MAQAMAQIVAQRCATSDVPGESLRWDTWLCSTQNAATGRDS